MAKSRANPRKSADKCAKGAFHTAELFDAFPFLENDRIIIRKMTDADVDALSEITDNENVYRYIPPFLFKKSKGFLLAAIRNLGGRDFEKRKLIIAGVYLRSEPERLVGLAEMFDYKKKQGTITIGYRLNERYWHQGFATDIVSLLVRYLSEDIGISTLCAYVMPENVYSGKALLRNGFIKQAEMAEEKNWGGQASVQVAVYTYRRKG